MNLWFRLIRILIAGFFAKRVAWNAVTQTHFHVWPTDLDINLHLTNSRYLALMDLGRVDLIFQTGLSQMVWRDKLAPVVASNMVRFRRPVGPFQRIILTSQVIGWDAKWIFIEHHVKCGDDLMCHAILKALFLGKTGAVDPDSIAKELGHDGPSPKLPEWVATWLAAEQGAAQIGKAK